MRIRSAGLVRSMALGLGFLALVGSQEALAQVKLEYKYPEGKKLAYKSTTKMQQTLTINGMEIPTTVEETSVSSQTAGKRRDDATLPLEHKMESIHFELELPGGMNVTFDSSDPNAKIENPQLAFLADVLKLVSEISYTVVLDSKSKVKAIEGAEKILEKADKLDATGRDAIRSRIEGEKLKTQFEQSHGNLPDILARPGESWERTETLDAGGGQTLTFRKKYEYVGTEKKGDKTLDKITSKAVDVKFSMDPNAQSPLKVTKSDLKVESSDGTILFDREAGCVVESKGKIQVKGNLTMTIQGMELPGALDLTMETNVQLQPPAK
ncbi:MAG: DUF6263 family protein [Isosphaeraceae bacterium]